MTMIYPAAALVSAFVLAVAGAALLRRRFRDFVSREAKPGKERIHRLYPRVRKPLGGGVAMMIALAAGGLLGAWWRGDAPRGLEAVAAIIVGAWLFAAIGLADDLRKARGRGLAERTKLLAQGAAALALGAYLKWRLLDGAVYLPLLGRFVDLGWLYPAWAALVIIAAANAVNLTDGVDGLAAGSVAIAALAYFGVGFVSPPVQMTAAALMGASLGFLVFNYPPARVIMGDTGALGLGAALAMMALVSLSEWLLVLVGGVFVIAALSVIVQTGAVRVMRGPLRLLRHRTSEPWRPFLCSPLHHHFQWLGWPEARILALFWGAGVTLGLLGLVGFALRAEWAWLVGLGLIAAFLAGAAWHKLVRANFFLGLLPSGGQEVLAAFRGLPLRVAGRALHQPWKVTPIGAADLGPVAAENLWRPLGEMEVALLLGKIYCEHKLYDRALEEWEQVPLRNLALRAEVALRLARIYYARNRVLDAIRVWEALPPAASPAGDLRVVVARAKARLADLAGKSYRQAMRSRDRAELTQARRLSQDLLELLVYEREKLEAPGAGAEAPEGRRQRTLFRRMERAVLARIADLDQQLAEPPVSPRPPAPARPDERTQAIARRLGLTPDQFAQAFAACPYGVPALRLCEAVAGPSRNEIYRLQAQWAGPESIIAKCYDPARITFFAACYRREAEVVRLLHGFGAAVPEFYGGVLDRRRAVGFFEDVGSLTLARRLREVGPEERARLLEQGVEAVARLHAAARSRLPRLREEILRIDKEALSERYYLDAFKVALGRLFDLAQVNIGPQEWQLLQGQLREIADTLATQPRTFIHFELTPDHLALCGERLVAFDFEQATIGPPEFDLVTLLRSPDADLPEAEVERLARAYPVLMRRAEVEPLPPSAPDAADYAALFKGLFYAGAAANFARKFGDQAWLGRMRWYLRDWHAVAQRHPHLADMAAMLHDRLAESLAADQGE